MLLRHKKFKQPVQICVEQAVFHTFGSQTDTSKKPTAAIPETAQVILSTLNIFYIQE